MQSAQLATSTPTELLIGLPTSQGLQQRQPRRVGADGFREAPQDALALLGVGAAPAARLEAAARGRDGQIDIGGGAARHLADERAVDRAHVLKYAPVLGGLRPPGDDGAPLGAQLPGEALPAFTIVRDGRGVHALKLSRSARCVPA